MKNKNASSNAFSVVSALNKTKREKKIAVLQMGNYNCAWEKPIHFCTKLVVCNTEILKLLFYTNPIARKDIVCSLDDSEKGLIFTISARGNYRTVKEKKQLQLVTVIWRRKWTWTVKLQPNCLFQTPVTVHHQGPPQGQFWRSGYTEYCSITRHTLAYVNVCFFLLRESLQTERLLKDERRNAPKSNDDDPFGSNRIWKA